MSTCNIVVNQGATEVVEVKKKHPGRVAAGKRTQRRKITVQPVHFLAKFKKLPPAMQSQLCGEIILDNYKHNPVSDPGDPQL